MQRIASLTALLAIASASACSVTSEAPDTEHASSTEQALAAGYIEFESPQGMCLNAQAAAQGAPLTVTPCSANGWQGLFNVVNVSGGLSELHVGNLCVDVTGAGTTNGTPLQFWPCNGTSAQRFVHYQGASYLGWMYHPASGKCLDWTWDGRAGEVGNRNVRLWDCNSTYEQVWRARAMLSVADGPHRIYANSAHTKCLDVTGGSSANGTPLQVYDCNSSAAQLFTFTNISTGPSQWTFEIRALGKCVDIRNAQMANHTPLQIYDCNGTIAQRFKVVGSDISSAGNGQWSAWGGDITTENGAFYLDRYGASLANGTVVQLYQQTSSGAQEWEAVPQYPMTPCAGCNVQEPTLSPSKYDANDTRFAVTDCSGSSTTRMTVYRSTDGKTWQNQGLLCVNNSRTYVDSNTQDNVTYHYRVMRAETAAVWNPVAWSADLPITVHRNWETPAKPGLAVQEAPDHITLTVTDNSTTEDGFRIYVRGPGDADYVVHTVPVANPPNLATGGTFTYLITNAQLDQEYDIKVTAYNQKDPSDPKTLNESEAATWTAFADYPPPPVENLAIVATATTTSSLRLTWTESSGHVSSFKVVRVDDGYEYPAVFSPPFDATGLASGKPYCFDVYALYLQQQSTPTRTCGTTN